MNSCRYSITTTVVISIIPLVIHCAKKSDYIFEDTDTKCSDSDDNDEDGFTDCEDQDCQAFSVCRDGGVGDSSLDFSPDSSRKMRDSEQILVPNDSGELEVCDEQDFVVNPKPVSIMLLLDYSSSMSIYPSTPPNRWSQAVSALTTLLSSISRPYVSFGLDYFPDGSDSRNVEGKIAECGVNSPVQSDCKSGNEKDIIDHLINTLAPPDNGNMTPMWCALNNFNDPSYAPGCTSPETDSYVVVISDGSDTCGQDCHCMDTPDTCGDPEYGAPALDLGSVASALCINSVKTFVISFGDGADYDKLNTIAQKGGTVLTSYLDANDEDELLTAFDKILDAVIPCEYEIEQPEEDTDPEQVRFYFDKDIVPNIGKDGDCETQDGWQWVNKNHTKMQFCENSCNQLKSGTVKEIKAQFGCFVVVM